MHDGIPPGNSNPHQRKAAVLIWTRAAADLPADQILLNALRADVLHVPCIGIEALPPPQAIKSGFQREAKIIFTSQNAVKICASWRNTEPKAFAALAAASEIITHGRKTADLAEKLLHRPVQCIDSATSEGLAGDVLRNRPTVGTPFIWFSGEEVAFDLSAQLEADGFPCHRIAVYRTGSHPTDADGRQLFNRDLDAAREQLTLRVKGCRIAICFASPSSVAGWLEFAGSESLLAPKFISAAVIGPTTARAATEAGFSRVTSCAWPQLADLAALGAQLAF
jgi:uroporphyrinogen-III synthase